MGNVNKSLSKAKSNKKDEFYTQLNDIERELKHYKKHLENQIIYCNCDDPRVSNFFHYFSYNFEFLGLKKLIATCYKNQSIDLFRTNSTEKSVFLEYRGDKNKNKIPDIEEINVSYLKGDGDFRSKECINILKEADIVITNPPFSLFREYISQLIKYEKKFLIIGHQNAITYKEVFKLFKDNKVWLGFGFPGSAGHFINHKYENYAKASDKKEGMIRVSGVNWFTNLDIKKRHEELILYKKYNERDYPKYDNYDAININKTSEIPLDFNGKMGVPITFMNQYNPEQFKILGIDRYIEDNPYYGKRFTIEGKEIYARIIIKNKNL